MDHPLCGLPVGIWPIFGLPRRVLAEQPRPAPAIALEAWPEVVAVVPARNEADVVMEAVGGLLRQDYPDASRSSWLMTIATT